MQIQKIKDVVQETKAELFAYQTGKKKIIKTNRPYLDNIFPVVNGTVITVSAQSGVGKSTEMMRIVNNVMDKGINPTAENFVSLIVSLEMRVLNIILRGLNTHTKKKKSKILSEEFTEEELILAKEYFKTLEDERNYISQVPTTPNKFFEACKEFLEQHKDKETCLIAYDHLALTNSDKGESRNTIIENLIERINDLKMIYKNVIFVLVSQTNSELGNRAKDKDIMSQPRASDLYYSQFTFQVSDYVVVINNPLKNGVKEYSKILPDRYPDLQKYFLEEDSKGRVSLETYGVLYYHLLKCREADEGIFVDIYAEDLNINGLEEKRTEIKKEKIITPTFPSQKLTAIADLPPLTPASLNDAFGQSFEDDKKLDEPF